MGLFTNIFISFIHLIIIAIDILSFFALIHLISCKWHYPWLQAFDTLGKPLVDWYGNVARTVINRLIHKEYPTQVILTWGLIFLVLIRWMLTIIFNAFAVSAV